MLEEELNRQSKRPGLCGLSSIRKGVHLLWRIAYKRRSYSSGMAFSLCAKPRP